jgi:uncharacterized protein (DUF983 family)
MRGINVGSCPNCVKGILYRIFYKSKLRDECDECHKVWIFARFEGIKVETKEYFNL